MSYCEIFYSYLQGWSTFIFIYEIPMSISK